MFASNNSVYKPYPNHFRNMPPNESQCLKIIGISLFVHVYELTRVDSSAALTTRRRPIFRISSPQWPLFQETFHLKKKIQLEFLARQTKDLPKYIPLSVFNQIVTNNSLNLALEQRLLGSNVQKYTISIFNMTYVTS